MKNQISFTTGLFDSGQIRHTNGGEAQLGEDLARWLFVKTKGDEFAFGEPFQQNGGWAEQITAEGENFKLGFALMPDSVGADHAEWLITIEKERKWKIFGSKDSELRGRLCDLIHNVLRDEGQIREVHWG
jgi:hypothetical protein